jgi:hypothetical protein
MPLNNNSETECTAHLDKKKLINNKAVLIGLITINSLITSMNINTIIKNNQTIINNNLITAQVLKKRDLGNFFSTPPSLYSNKKKYND